ncbi:MAG: hypothetical protein PHQ43_11380 [Dehalococcoidales bacterium]|nr:hypothetical protein [Dehalococcoidales bacterium]
MRKIVARIRKIFPVRPISAFSRSNKGITFGVFSLCIALAIIRGYLHKDKPDPYAFIGFFDSWTGVSREIFNAVVKALYSPPGVVAWLLIVFLIFLWLTFRFSGMKSRLRFREFVTPFAGLSYVACLVWLASVLFWVSSKELPYFMQMAIFLYWLIYYWQIMILEYGLTPRKAAFSVVVPYICVFPLGGFPSIAPYLLWAGG